MKLFFILSCTDARQRDTEKLRAVNKNPRFKDSLGGKKFIIFHSRRAGHGRGEAKSDSWCCRAQSMLSWVELSCQGRYGCIWVCVLSFFLALQAPCEAQNWQRWLTTQQYKPECEKKQKRPFSLSLPQGSRFLIQKLFHLFFSKSGQYVRLNSSIIGNTRSLITEKRDYTPKKLQDQLACSYRSHGNIPRI